MSAPILEASDAYALSLWDYREAQDRLRVLAAPVRELADALWLAPRHPAAAGRIPRHVLTGPVRREVDLTGWPDATGVLEALAALHRTHARAHALYAWLLPEDRAQVETP